MAKLNVIIDDELYHKFKVVMAQKNLTISEFVRRAMLDFIKADEIVQNMKRK